MTNGTATRGDFNSKRDILRTGEGPCASNVGDESRWRQWS